MVAEKSSSLLGILWVAFLPVLGKSPQLFSNYTLSKNYNTTKSVAFDLPHSYDKLHRYTPSQLLSCVLHLGHWLHNGPLEQSSSEALCFFTVKSL